MKPFEIAIIGLAGRFPGAATLRDFHLNLRLARDCVVEIPAQRFCESNFPIRDERYQVMGLLDQVDRFDRKFFSLSPRESQQMDPHQRLTLEVAYEAIEDSGYSPASFSGTEAAMIVADADYHYAGRLTEPDPSMYSGNAQFSMAGRLARFFNTTGPAFVVDTGCSSGLMGVSLACDQLALGRASVALVAGARIVIDSLPVVIPVDIGITSNDGKTRSFNADSNGSGSSEAVVAVLLKPLAQARRDRDSIYAVIKATAVNASAQSSASLTATSSAAQAALLKQAWERAGINPQSIDYVEAHGSGTKLGDPIEINGLDTAFRHFTDRLHFCAVSSVKSNIGHTDKVAGLCGLAKAALSLKHRELYPSLHFNRPNPLIDFARSATYINTELKPWPQPADHPRRAGVSSFGFAGNNVHVVLEEFIDDPASADPLAPAAAPIADGAAPGAPLTLIAVSSKRPDGVAANLAALDHFLASAPPPPLADIAFTLNTGREHFRHRAAFLVRDLADLRAQLQAFTPGEPGRPRAEDAQLLLLFSDDSECPAGITEALSARFPAFARARADGLAALTTVTDTPPPAALLNFVFQYSLSRLLEDLGATSAHVIGLGVGELAAQAALGELTLSEALRQLPAVAAASQVVPDDFADRLTTLLDRQSEIAPVALVEMGTAGRLSRWLRELAARRAEGDVAVLTLASDRPDAIAALFQQLYVAGVRLDWTAFHRQAGGRRVSLPGYQFEKIRCWYGPPHPLEAYETWRRTVYGDTAVPGAAGSLISTTSQVSAATPRSAPTSIDATWTATEQTVARIWLDILRLDSVGLDDDFFALGGHSLFGSMVRNRIERELGLKLEFKDIFAQSRIRTLARSLDRQLAAGAPRAAETAIPRIAPAPHYAVSPAQFRLWLLDQKEGSMEQAYNVTIVIRLHGALDADRLAAALQQLVVRHEVLRTHFIEVDGEPRQVVNEAVDFAVERVNAAEEFLPSLIDTFVRPFDLSRAPLVRAAIFRLAENSHVLALDLHHTLFDGSSYGLLLRDLSALYTGRSLPAIALTYKDYAAWHAASSRGEALRAAEAYWLKLFQRVPAPLELPTDFPRPAVRSFAGGIIEAKIDAVPLLRLRTVAQQGNATLFMTLLAAYSVLLSKYSGHTDIVVGSSVAGRTHADLEPVVGLFVNTVAFRTAPRGDLSFREFLAEVREHCFETYQHQDYPFESLVRQLGHPADRSRNPLFDTMLVLQNLDFGSGELADGLRLTPGEFVRHSAKFDLTVECYESPAGLHFNLEYAQALFKPATVERIARDLAALLVAVGENPSVRLSEIEIDQGRRLVGAVAGDFTFADL